MAEPVLSVCWKNHTNELATEYKSLLENNFLVDCTLSAEGQRLKAHRLVLSACSPYFQMLFQEDSGKHPFVILLNATFETLKAVIDFVYQGETQIPESNFKAFLTLAQSLQIKGLNTFTQDYENKNQSCSTAVNLPRGSSENNQVASEVHGINASLGTLENYSQHNPHLSDSYSDTVQTNFSVPVEELSASCENAQSATSVTHLAEHHRPLGCDEVFADSEVTIKHEPVYHAFSETRNKTSVDVTSCEPGSGNFVREMDVRTASVGGEEDLNIFSNCGESSCGKMESFLMPLAQEQLTQLSNEVPSGQDVAERGETSQPVGLVLKKEHLGDECDDLMDDRDMPVNDTNEADEEMEPAYGEHNPDQCSRAGGLLPENDPESQRRSGVRLWSSGALESKAPSEVVPHAPSAAEPGRKASTSRPRLAGSSHTRVRARAFSCDVCGVSFTCPSHLAVHNRKHTGERPYRCDLCGNSFIMAHHLSNHKRTHTGERPYPCEVCGLAFTRKGTLANHKRIHTGERPHRCGECGKTFIDKINLVRHRRTHTGERPYRCDLCGSEFAHPSALANHKRIHTGERAFACDQCGVAFAQPSTLANHKRTHAE